MVVSDITSLYRAEPSEGGGKGKGKGCRDEAGDGESPEGRAQTV